MIYFFLLKLFAPADLSRKTTGSSEKWILQVEDLSSILRAKKKDPKYSRVRIAIIDSGMKKDHPFAKSVKVFRDFVTSNINLGDNNNEIMDESEPSDEMVDETQHGSIGVSLIGRLAPEADMYVARVFEGSTASVDTQNLIAKV